MLTLTNWWPPYSRASILSALNIGYRVHVIVSDSQNDPPAEPFLRSVKARFGDRVHWSGDSMPRSAPADHALTRYDYLPEVMGRYRLPTLVTDADVIHRRRIHLPEHADVGLRYQRPMPLPDLERFSSHEGLPAIWGVFALWLMIATVYLAPTRAAFDFAARIKLFIDSLRPSGLASRIGSDQLAVFAATRHLDEHRVHIFNRSDCRDICSDPAHHDHAIWLPHSGLDPGNEWSKAAAALTI